MIRHLHAIGLIIMMASFALTWTGLVLAAATGNLGVSASVMERCRVDFSEGSADYFQSCTSVDVKASGTASNVIGEVSAVDASADPYYLDRDPGSQGIAAAIPSTAGTSAANSSAAPLALAERKGKGPKVVTIQY